ncbi:MAG TPA: hypothetical protein VFR74_07115, partial [Jiangellales bacterium]|nr:hypothetical protein [Jiangellales bacterium]
LPLTGRGVVHRVITDLAVVDIETDAAGGHLVLRELAPGVTVEEVRERTGPELGVPASPPPTAVGPPRPAPGQSSASMSVHPGPTARRGSQPPEPLPG